MLKTCAANAYTFVHLALKL